MKKMKRNIWLDFRIFNPLNTFKYQFLSSNIVLIIIFNINFGVEGAQPNYHRIKITSEDCPVGYYIKNVEQKVRCFPCKLCHKGFHVKTWCNGTNKPECEQCPKGTFNDVRGGTCQPCSTCNVGEFIKRKCLPTRDTKCQRCPKGKYSVNGQGHVCRHCTRCHEVNRVEITPCRAEHNSVCGQCLPDHFSELGGRCLQCSFCEYSSHQRFVPDCAKQNGLDDTHLCWPDTRVRLLYADSNAPTTVAVSTEVVRGYHNDNAMLVLVVCSFVVGWGFLIFTVAWVMHRASSRYKLERCWNNMDGVSVSTSERNTVTQTGNEPSEVSELSEINNLQTNRAQAKSTQDGRKQARAQAKSTHLA